MRGLQEEALEKQSSYFHFFWTGSGVTASQFPPKTHPDFNSVFLLCTLVKGRGRSSAQVIPLSSALGSGAQHGAGAGGRRDRELWLPV